MIQPHELPTNPQTAEDYRTIAAYHRQLAEDWERASSAAVTKFVRAACVANAELEKPIASKNEHMAERLALREKQKGTRWIVLPASPSMLFMPTIVACLSAS